MKQVPLLRRDVRTLYEPLRYAAMVRGGRLGRERGFGVATDVGRIGPLKIGPHRASAYERSRKKRDCERLQL